MYGHVSQETAVPKMASFVYLTEADVEKYLDCNKLLEVLEDAFVDFSKGNEGGTIQPVRSSIRINEHNGFFGVMPGYSRKQNALACKLVTAYPNNTAISTHHANICLFDPANGVLLAILAGEHITGMRTALASAVATKYLARKDSRKLALLGTGTQAKSHLEALRMVYHFDEVSVWGRTYANAQKFAESHGCRACQTVEEAVADADVICTVTFSTTPVLKAEWVKDGAHINAVGAVSPKWQELDCALMRKAVVYADSREACLKESGDVILSQCEIYAELGEVIPGKKDARVDSITVFKSVGIAVEDVVSAKLVYDAYMETNKPST